MFEQAFSSHVYNPLTPNTHDIDQFQLLHSTFRSGSPLAPPIKGVVRNGGDFAAYLYAADRYLVRAVYSDWRRKNSAGAMITP